MSYKKNITSTLISQIVLLIIGFVVDIIIARALGPFGRGQYAYFILIFGLIARFGNFGINDSFGYFIKRTDNSDENIKNNNFTFVSLMAFFYLSVTFILYQNKFILIEYDKLIILMGGLYVFLNYYESNLKVIYTINEKIFLFNRFKVFATIAKASIAFLLLILNVLTMNSFITLSVATLALPIIGMMINLKFRFRFSLDFGLIKAQLKYGIVLYLSALFIFLNYRMDQFMIKWFLDVGSLGVYSIGVTLAELVFMIPHSIINPLRGRLFNMENSQESKRSITIKTTKYTFYVCLIVSVIGSALTPLVPLVYGKEYAGSISVIIILFVGVTFVSIAKISSNYFYTEGKVKVHLLASFVSFVINIILNVVLIPSLGINGAAIASTISYFIFALIYVLMLIRYSEITIGSFFIITKDEFKQSIAEIFKMKKSIK